MAGQYFVSDRGGHGEPEDKYAHESRVGEAGTFANVNEYGGGSGHTPKENSRAIRAALNALFPTGGDLFFPESLAYDETIVPTDGVRLIGRGSQQRWRSPSSGVKLSYTGTGNAIHIFNEAGGTREAVEIWSLRFDGKTLSGSTNGLFVDGTAGSAIHYVEGIYLFDSAFTNFPGYQFLSDGLLIDIISERCAFNNVEAPNNNQIILPRHTGEAAKIITQMSFNECLIAQYGENWALQGGGVDLRFNGGTVTTNGQKKGSGLHCGTLTLVGTHLEGIAKASESVGIRYEGANNANIQPSYCAAWETGIEIGEKGSANRAIGATINGMVGGNTVDIRITNGGSRKGTKIITTGEATGSPPVIENERLAIDGEQDVMNLQKGPVATPAESTKSIIEALKSLGLVK
jgi:hypothetical protein